MSLLFEHPFFAVDALLEVGHHLWLELQREAVICFSSVARNAAPRSKTSVRVKTFWPFDESSNEQFFLKKNRPSPATFSIIFIFSKKYYNFLQQINVKNGHKVYGAGIRTHKHQNMSLLL